MKNFKYCRSFLAGLALSIFLLSCEKKEYDPNFELSRQFTSSGFRITEGETSVKVEWAPSLFTEGKPVSYTIEVSKTADFQGTPVYTKKVEATEVTITNSDLQVRQPYYARVKTNALNSTAESNWVVSPSFIIKGEQIFVAPVPESDIIDRAVILRWTTTPGVTKIVLTPQAATSFEIPITAGDNTAGQKLVENLAPNTTYTAEIFVGTLSKGFLTFKTKATITGTSIIDLRSISGRPSVLADTLPVIPSGSIVILKRGLTYNISSTTNLTKSVTILSGTDFIPDLASIYFTSNFNIAANSSIDSIVFQDLNLYSDDYASRYVFNINQVGTIGKVKFENVRGHRFRGFFRMQTGSTGTKVTDFIMNNSIVDSLRDFSLVNTNNSNTVANIKVTNTTIYNARKVVDHRSPGSNSITFENCTFHNLPGGGPAAVGGTTYFIDLGSQNSANPILIKNCIFGRSWDDQGLGNDARGIQTGATTSVTVQNSFRTSDFISTNATYQIQGLTAYSGSSNSLFTDPDNGNFKINDNGFAGRNNSGDPRWRIN